MSYTRDRSSMTRGVGAIASQDLRESRGGAVVRTGAGMVRIVPKSALGASDNRGRGRGQSEPRHRRVLTPHQLHMLHMKRTGKSLTPHQLHVLHAAHVANVKSGRGGRAGAAGRGGLMGRGGRLGRGGAISPEVSSFSNAGIQSGGGGSGGPASGGGGGGGPSSGGGPAFTPDEGATDAPPEDEAAIQEQEAAAAASARLGPEVDATTPAPTTDAKPPMSTGTKVAAAAGVGWMLLKMLGKGF